MTQAFDLVKGLWRMADGRAGAKEGSCVSQETVSRDKTQVFMTTLSQELI